MPHNEHDIDSSLATAFEDVSVDDELKAATMARIASTRAAQEAEEPDHEGIVDTKTDTRKKVAGIAGKRRTKSRFLAIAASLALCILIATGAFHIVDNTETAYAEVAPQSAQASIVIGVNRFDKVIKVTGSNATIQAEFDSLHLVGMNYDEAMDAIADSGYLGQDNVDVRIGGNNVQQQENMSQKASECLSNSGYSGECNGRKYGKQDGSGMQNGANGSAGNANANGTGNANGAHNGSTRHSE